MQTFCLSHEEHFLYLLKLPLNQSLYIVNVMAHNQNIWLFIGTDRQNLSSCWYRFIGSNRNISYLWKDNNYSSIYLIYWYREFSPCWLINTVILGNTNSDVFSWSNGQQAFCVGCYYCSEFDPHWVLLNTSHVPN